MTRSDTLLSEYAIQRIRAYNPSLISPPEENESHFIAIGLLYPGYNPPALPRCSSSSAPQFPNRSTLYIRIPTHLSSAATLEFLCFTPAYAEALYALFLAKQIELNMELSLEEWACEFVVSQCEGVEDVEDDWESALRDAGIETHIRDALMNPQTSHVRGVQTLAEWMEEIVRDNFSLLVELNERVLSRLGELGG